MTEAPDPAASTVTALREMAAELGELADAIDGGTVTARSISAIATEVAADLDDLADRLADEAAR